MLDMEVPAAYSKLCENAKTSFATLKMQWSAYAAFCNTDFQQLTESPEGEMEYSLFENQNSVFTYPPYNVESAGGKNKLGNELIHEGVCQWFRGASLEVYGSESP